MIWPPFGSEYSLLDRWSRVQRAYITAFGLVDLPSRLRARLVTEELRRLRWTNLLDLGSGTGCYCFYCSRRHNARVWGVDINESRIAECRAALSRLGRNNLEFLTGSAHNGTSGFDSGSMDVVLSIEALQCFPDQKSALLEIFRLLKPGGHFIGHVPVLGYLREFENFLFDDANLPIMLREAGFEIVSITATFGQGIRLLCGLFDRLSRSQVLTALTFPLLLLTSLSLRVSSPSGEYRLFIARKPLAGSFKNSTLE